MSGLVIDVSKLAGNPGGTMEILASEPVAGLSGGLGYVDEREKLGVRLVAEALAEGIAVSGRVSGTLHLSCSRCLVEYEERLAERVDEVFYFRPQDEGYRVDGRTIDLEPMLRDIVLLAIPPRPLHRADCRGLCPECGADRNAGDCGHERGRVEARWQPLRRLLEEQTQDKER